MDFPRMKHGRLPLVASAGFGLGLLLCCDGALTSANAQVPAAATPAQTTGQKSGTQSGPSAQPLAVSAILEKLKHPKQGDVIRSAADFLHEVDKAEPAQRKQVVDELTKAIEGNAPFAEKRGPIWMLGLLGTNAPEATAELIKLLKDPSPAIRNEVYTALHDSESEEGERALAVAAETVLPPLVTALGDSNEGKRQEAMSGIANLRGHAKPILPKLLELLNTKGDKLWEDPAMIVSDFEAEFDTSGSVRLVDSPAKVRAISSGYPILLHVIYGLDEETGIRLALETLRKSKMPLAKASALLIVGEVVEEDETHSAVEDIIKALQDPSLIVQKEALSALPFSAEKGKAARAEYATKNLAPLIQALKASDVKSRQAALATLPLLEDAASGALPALQECLSDASIRPDVLLAIGTIAGGADNAIADLPKLITTVGQYLKDADWRSRQAAAYALAQFEHGTEAVLPLLEAALAAESSEDVQFGILAALRTVGTQKSRTAVANTIVDHTKSEPVRADAALKIAYMASEAPETIDVLPILLKAIKEEPPSVREAVVHALAELSSHDPRAKSAMEAARTDSDSEVRETAERLMSEE